MSKKTATRTKDAQGKQPSRTPSRSDKSKNDRAPWPFEDDPSLAVVTLKRIIKDHRPVLYVVHDEDGGWQFLDGGDVTAKDSAVAGLGEMLTHIDHTLDQTATLPRGWHATREFIGGPWFVRPNGS